MVAEQHDDLLMNNHEVCSTESAPLLEAHEEEAHGLSEERQNNWGHNNVRA